MIHQPHFALGLQRIYTVSQEGPGEAKRPLMRPRDPCDAVTPTSSWKPRGPSGRPSAEKRHPPTAISFTAVLTVALEATMPNPDKPG